MTLGFGWFLFWIWIVLGFRWIGSGRFFLDLDGFSFGSGSFGFFARFGFGRFFFQYWILVFFRIWIFWSSFGLDWFGFSSEMDLSVFSRDWISNGIFKKLLK